MFYLYDLSEITRFCFYLKINYFCTSLDQDEGLEALSNIISRQKHMALDIGNEVDAQNGKLFFSLLLAAIPASKKLYVT